MLNQSSAQLTLALTVIRASPSPFMLIEHFVYS